jgi:hypothetical protein
VSNEDPSTTGGVCHSDWLRSMTCTSLLPSSEADPVSFRSSSST